MLSLYSFTTKKSVHIRLIRVIPARPVRRACSPGIAIVCLACSQYKIYRRLAIICFFFFAPGFYKMNGFLFQQGLNQFPALALPR